jgi:hypothetical protein
MSDPANKLPVKKEEQEAERSWLTKPASLRASPLRSRSRFRRVRPGIPPSTYAPLDL